MNICSLSWDRERNRFQKCEILLKAAPFSHSARSTPPTSSNRRTGLHHPHPARRMPQGTRVQPHEPRTQGTNEQFPAPSRGLAASGARTAKSG